MKQSEEDYVVIVKTLIADRRNMGSSYLGKNYRLKTLESLKFELISEQSFIEFKKRIGMISYKDIVYTKR
jgi:hypothetical protein